MAIGDHILDLSLLSPEQLPPELVDAMHEPTLNAVFGRPPEIRRRLRAQIFDLLSSENGNHLPLTSKLHLEADCELLLPTRIGGYTDFYAGIVHATNVGRLLRPDNPLMPNYKQLPIGYHGRSSSIRASGTPVRRPRGQVRSAESVSQFVASRQLDFELELGLWVGEGNKLGSPIPISEAGEHLAGVSLLNDWSARDIQAWEYQPLGPFLAKNFASTVSPWVITMEALSPFRTAHTGRAVGDPPLLPYLLDAADQATGALAISVQVSIQTSDMRHAGLPADILGRTSATCLYWTPAQLIAHHTSNGCSLEPGDLLGTGTISSPGASGYGSLMEISFGGTVPRQLTSGETRTFLEDGDEVVITGRCEREGFASIGFGECRAVVLSSNPN